MSESWECDLSGGIWSCDGDIGSSNSGSESWECAQSDSGNWGCRGNVKAAIFTLPIPLLG